MKISMCFEETLFFTLICERAEQKELLLEKRLPPFPLIICVYAVIPNFFITTDRTPIDNFTTDGRRGLGTHCVIIVIIIIIIINNNNNNNIIIIVIFVNTIMYYDLCLLRNLLACGLYF